jgi:hypothetical protein
MLGLTRDRIKISVLKHTKLATDHKNGGGICFGVSAGGFSKMSL